MKCGIAIGLLLLFSVEARADSVENGFTIGYDHFKNLPKPEISSNSYCVPFPPRQIDTTSQYGLPLLPPISLKSAAAICDKHPFPTRMPPSMIIDPPSAEMDPAFAEQCSKVYNLLTKAQETERKISDDADHRILADFLASQTEKKP